MMSMNPGHSSKWAKFLKNLSEMLIAIFFKQENLTANYSKMYDHHKIEFWFQGAKNRIIHRAATYNKIIEIWIFRKNI